jgi:hypothetical protein
MNGPMPPISGNDVDYDSLAEHGPTNILISFVIAGALVACGIWLIVRHDLPWLPAESFRNSGKHAVGTGIVMIGAGIVMHFRMFWQSIRPDMWYTTLGWIVGLLTLICGAVVIVLRFLRII